MSAFEQVGIALEKARSLGLTVDGLILNPDDIELLKKHTVTIKDRAVVGSFFSLGGLQIYSSDVVPAGSFKLKFNQAGLDDFWFSRGAV